MKRTLKASPRNVILRVTTDYPPGQLITPDQVLINGKPFASDDKSFSNKIKPGKYSLMITKAGYDSVKKEIFIPAGTSDYIIQEQMNAAPRIVKYKIYNSETKQELIPDKITLGTQPITQDSPFKPGKYRLYVRTPGYPDIVEGEHEIPPGVGPHLIERGLLPQSREIRYEITSDYDLKPIDPTEITLNSKSLKENKAFAPGPYELVVFAPGYDRLVKRVEFGPSRDPFTIREELKAKPRKVIYNITGSYAPQVKLNPDKVAFDGKGVLDGEPVKPKAGGYSVVVDKAGYNSFTKTMPLEPSEQPFELKVQLQTRPRRLQFDIDSDYKPNVALQPDKIEVDGKNYPSGSTVDPGERQIGLHKAGYEVMNFKQDVPPGVEPFEMKKTLISKMRRVKVKVISDFSGQPIEEPEVCNLSGRSVGDHKFKPGGYELDIRHLGYHQLREKVEIEPGETPQEFTRTLIAKNRKIEPIVTFDRKPLPDSQPHVIRMSSLAQSIRIEVGDELKPGEYKINIEKEGYNPLNERWILLPGEKPDRKEFEMISKMVEILIEITYDIQPPKGLPPYTVTFVDREGIPRAVSHGKKIKPGHYKLQINRPGYEFKDANKAIHVPPGTKPFWVKEQLLAKPRPLSFGMAHDGKMIQATEILLDGKQVKAADTFEPGKQYKMLAKFKEFKTVQKNIEIVPGESPFVVDVTMAKLKKYEFRIAKRFFDINKGMVLDGVRYPFEIFVDGEQVEPHQIIADESSRAFSLIFGTFYAGERSRSVRAVCAFYHDETLVKNMHNWRDLEKIDVTRLIEHLREVAKTAPGNAVRRVNRLLRDHQDRSKITSLPRDERNRIISVLRDFTLNSRDQSLRNQLIEKLQK